MIAWRVPVIVAAQVFLGLILFTAAGFHWFDGMPYAVGYLFPIALAGIASRFVGILPAATGLLLTVALSMMFIPVAFVEGVVFGCPTTFGSSGECSRGWGF